MNDFSDNPFNIPSIDIDDIPVLDDVVTQNDVPVFTADESTLTKEEHTNIDTAQLEIIIEQIAVQVTTRIQQELETQIEKTVLHVLEESLHTTLQQNKEFIKESINSLLKERLPEILNTSTTSSDQSTL